MKDILEKVAELNIQLQNLCSVSLCPSPTAAACTS